MQTLNYQFFFASKLLQNIEYKYDGDDDDDDERDNDVIKNRESVSFVIIKLNFCSLYIYIYYHTVLLSVAAFNFVSTLCRIDLKRSNLFWF